jgi:hypothetical protein
MTDQLIRDVDREPTIAQINLTAFLASGIASTSSESIGREYSDADGTRYTPMFEQDRRRPATYTNDQPCASGSTGNSHRLDNMSQECCSMYASASLSWLSIPLLASCSA